MPKISDLRTYILALEETGQLARIKTQVQLTHELADVAATLVRSGGGLFENVAGSAWPIFSSGVANQNEPHWRWDVTRMKLLISWNGFFDPNHGIQPLQVKRPYGKPTQPPMQPST